MENNLKKAKKTKEDNDKTEDIKSDIDENADKADTCLIVNNDAAADDDFGW